MIQGINAFLEINHPKNPIKTGIIKNKKAPWWNANYNIKKLLKEEKC